MMDVMLDLETLGTAPGSVILSIGAVMFDRNGLGTEFYTVINQMSCMDAGLKTDPDTLAWWTQQSPEARQVLEDSRTSDMELADALRCLNAFLDRIGKDVRVWGNGSDFDNVLTVAAFKAAGIKPGWRFSNSKCFRTLKGLRPNHVLPVREGTHHNALDDAKYRAKVAIPILTQVGYFPCDAVKSTCTCRVVRPMRGGICGNCGLQLSGSFVPVIPHSYGDTNT